MLSLVKNWDWKEVERGLEEKPALLAWRDPRGRNWLHVCCAVNFRKRKQKPQDGIRTAELLLGAGLGLSDPAFTEGNWKATPLWYAVAFGQNLALAEYLLKRGSDPNHCLWAAAFNNDVAAIRLLAANGAELDASVEDASPFLFGIQWSRFAAAEELLKLGANVDFQNSKGITALHCLLKKGSDKKYVRMLVRYGARTDLKDAKGRTAAEILRRKRDPELRALVS
jgi:ankyrin repeat protein